jgi:hypothetical protein
MDAFMLIHADPEFFASVDKVTAKGIQYQPSAVPAQWSRADAGVWTQWYPEGKLGGVEQGWKIHISCQIARAQHVLDTAAAIFYKHNIAFKHLGCEKFFILTHHKHAARQQSGKFCVAYPPDEATARQVMAELAAALPGEVGPYVLTDRRFRDSLVVHYRYGAYVSKSRVRVDGTTELLMNGADGASIPDQRGTRFHLPDGMSDPFTGLSEGPVARASGRTPGFGGYEFQRVLQHSNSGGAYQAREVATGRTVFIKESRAHNGLIDAVSTGRDRLHREHGTLLALHGVDPGLCPEPISLFRRWEHDYLVTEFVAGQTLWHWEAANNPIIWANATDDDFQAYYRRCEQILDDLSGMLAKIHELGYVFIDLNPNNVLIDDDDRPRLIDFELAVPAGEKKATPMGAPGYFPRVAPADGNLAYYDEYGLSALALNLIAPLNTTVERNPAVLPLLREELGLGEVIPAPMWALATRSRDIPASTAGTPSPAQLERDPAGELSALRDRIVVGLLASGTDIPLGPRSYATNALCAAHGLAGVVHSLGNAGAPVAGLLERLREQSLADAGELAPGLDVGLAGIAWVLAEHGHADEAKFLLAAADAHPLLAGHATLGQGRAGVGLAHLALYRATGDGLHLDRAAALADSIPRDESLSAQLGAHNAIGLIMGRSGIALLDFYLAEATGERDRLAGGLRLLASDLDRAKPFEGGLLFPVSEKDSRIMPYLYYGTAGVGMVASRYLAATGEERLAATLPGLIAGVGSRFTMYGGLYAGMAGVGLFLDDHARRHGDGTAAAAAARAARRMFLYAVPHGAGSWLVGETGLRLSGDLWYGSAGVLAFLTQYLTGRPDAIFTLDGVGRKRTGDGHHETFHHQPSITIPGEEVRDA